MDTGQDSLNDLYRRWNAEDRTVSALTAAFKILVGTMWAIVLFVARQAGVFGYLLHATGLTR